jgi:Fe-S cluster assembly protein SufD
MHQGLATDSDLIFVWHENSGQAFPDNSPEIQTIINADGFKVIVADNSVIHKPLVFISSADKSNALQNELHIGKNAQLQIIEYVMSDDADTANTTNTIINCAAGVQLKHCLLQYARDNTAITQQSTTCINLACDSKATTNIFSFGGALSKIELAIALQGENSSCEASCLAYTRGTENQNVLLKIDHLVPHCTSSSISRGVLKDKSITDFVGKIFVHPGAKQSFADLQIKSILCSPQSQANNRPELEIYNDDVRCSHGASTGQMNEDALFYMRSRGIDEETAKEMLIDGFILPAIVSCTIPKIADLIKSIVAER